MSQIQINYRPRNRRGEPLDMGPITFVADASIMKQDPARPLHYTTSDRSAAYSVPIDDMELLDD